MTSRATEHRIVLGLALIFALLMLAWPEIDLQISREFYLANGRWRFDNDMLLPGLAYRWIPLLAWASFALILARLLGLGSAPIPAHRTRLIFLLCALLSGPVLLVDVLLKGHSGRARPLAVQEFGGARQFTPVLQPAQQCDWNCSFVSGHVATAATSMAFGWLAGQRQRRRWLFISLFLAAYVGWARVAVGAHFFSDVVFAWFAIYGCLWLLEKCLPRAKCVLQAITPTAQPGGRPTTGDG